MTSAAEQATGIGYDANATLVAAADDDGGGGGAASSLVALRMLRLVRVTRIFKLGKQAEVNHAKRARESSTARGFCRFFLSSSGAPGESAF